MNLDYDGLNQELRINKIVSNDVDITKMLLPYLHYRKKACELFILSEPNHSNRQEAIDIINYCNTQIKLILTLD
jgi:hypothetical protein